MKRALLFFILIILIILSLAVFLKYDRVEEQQLINNIFMDLTSDFFEDGEALSQQFTCDGENVNPPLSISGVPEETETLAIIVTDPDAPAGIWSHWIVFNISPDTDELDENSVPTGASQGVNDFGNMGWGGPCPSEGEHHYVFTLYALDSDLDLPEGADREAVIAAMEGHILEQAELTGVYSRG
jgi:hypothetical protein